ncbi:MAG: PBP1A family penicillin-binding protein [Candidatus Buchananbacteria bacterium]
MPIPGLSSKIKSPQDWRNKRFTTTGLGPSSFNRRPIYTGSGRRKKPFNFFKTGLALLGIFIILGSVMSLIFLAWAAQDLPNPNRISDRSVALSTKIYDRTGKVILYDVHGTQKRTFVKLEEIPKFLKDATIATEDRKFYEHSGVSITGIIRSVIKNITTGSKVGGSTITQQLVKNAILSPEKKYTRKIKEVILSYQIEKKFTKDEILQMYFNEIPYGSVAYGAEAASQTYFGKSVKDITLAQAAILAALPQAPTYYSPYGTHVDRLLARQKYVLDSMAELGYISKDQAEQAKKEKIEFQKSKESITAPHFVMYIKEYLTEKYGDLVVEQGGLKVITTLDADKQKMAEEAVKQGAEKNLKWNASNAALVALDPLTGQILAMVGSKDYFDEKIQGQFNVVTSPRQPGSSFKPIVYAAAFKKGYTPDTILYDVNTKFLNYDGQNYEPKNYDLKEHGPLTMRSALAGSLNIPAVKTIYLTGVDKVIDLAQDLGYSTLNNRSRFGLSLVLGGGEVKLLEHANAFAVFAREGDWHQTASILEVRDKDDNLLEEFKKQEKKVLETQVARQLNSILTDNAARAYIFGEKNYLTLGDRPVAAKTGTTNDYHDAWTMGFTPSLVAGVWVGNNDNTEMKRGADGSVVAAPIWHQFMAAALANTPVEGFTAPDPITTTKPILNGAIAKGITLKIDTSTGQVANDQTPSSLIEERTYRPVHCILHYINKDDPQGDTLPDLADPQYQRWEEAVQNWAKANNIIAQDPPAGYENNTGNTTGQAAIKIISPSANQTITNRQLNAQVSIGNSFNPIRVDYYLNDVLKKSITQSPFDLSVYLDDPTLNNGFYQLKAITFDVSGNSNSDSIDLNLQLPPIPATLDWTSPANNGTISVKKFPYSLKANISNIQNINNISLYYQDGLGKENFIGTAHQFDDSKLLIQWFSAPAPGNYQLYAQITNTDGYSYRTEITNVTIK